MSGLGIRPGPGETDWEIFDVKTDETVEGGMDNQTAWKRLDRLTMEAVSRGESVTDWLWAKRLQGS
jgi:hypothetical protein